MCPSDRREVQKHHCERWELGFEKENQRADSGKTRMNGMFCMSSLSSVPLLPDTTVQMCLTGEPAVKTGADEVSNHSGLSAQWDGHAEDRANWSEPHLRTVNFLYFLTLLVYQIAVGLLICLQCCHTVIFYFVLQDSDIEVPSNKPLHCVIIQPFPSQTTFPSIQDERCYIRWHISCLSNTFSVWNSLNLQLLTCKTDFLHVLMWS